MNPIYTTHLICAPQLEAPTIIGALLAEPGDYVEADDPLVLLYSAGMEHEVCAPEAGVIGYYTVNINESIASNDLLLTMEIEEKPIGFSPILDEEPEYAAACKQAEPLTQLVKASYSEQKSLQISHDAAVLASKLGVNLTELKADEEGMINEEVVTEYVRDILMRWNKIQNLVRK